MILLTASLLAGVPVAAQRPDLPPEAVVARALDDHPAVAAARARIDSARAQERMLRRGDQEFVFQGTASRRSIEGEGDYAEFDANVTRPIRLPGKAAMDREAGALGIDVAHNLMEDVRHQTALAFSDLWHDWLIADALHRNDIATSANLRDAARAVGRRAELRDAAALEVDQAGSALAAAEAQASASLAEREEARARLAMNFPDIPLPDQPPAMSVPSFPIDNVEELRGYVVRRSHEIEAADREAKRLAVMARRTRADRLPDPSVGVRLFSERGGLERGAGLVASIPFGGGYRRAAGDQADAQASSARLELERVRREVEATASADLSNVRTRQTVWQAMLRSADSASAAADRTEQGYRLGAIDLADSLLARRQANDARRQEIQARGDLLRAITKLRVDAHDVWTSGEDVHTAAP